MKINIDGSQLHRIFQAREGIRRRFSHEHGLGEIICLFPTDGGFYVVSSDVVVVLSALGPERISGFGDTYFSTPDRSFVYSTPVMLLQAEDAERLAAAVDKDRIGVCTFKPDWLGFVLDGGGPIDLPGFRPINPN